MPQKLEIWRLWETTCLSLLGVVGCHVPLYETLDESLAFSRDPGQSSTGLWNNSFGFRFVLDRQDRQNFHFSWVPTTLRAQVGHICLRLYWPWVSLGPGSEGLRMFENVCFRSKQSRSFFIHGLGQEWWRFLVAATAAARYAPINLGSGGYTGFQGLFVMSPPSVASQAATGLPLTYFSHFNAAWLPGRICFFGAVAGIKGTKAIYVELAQGHLDPVSLGENIVDPAGLQSLEDCLQHLWTCGSAAHGLTCRCRWSASVVLEWSRRN